MKERRQFHVIFDGFSLKKVAMNRNCESVDIWESNEGFVGLIETYIQELCPLLKGYH